MRKQGAARASAHGSGVEHGKAGIGIAVLCGRRSGWRSPDPQQFRVGHKGGSAAADAVPALDGRQRWLLALQHRLETGIGDDDPGCGVACHVGDFICAQAPIDGHQDRTKSRGGAVEVDELEIVLRQHDDAVTRCDAGSRQAGGQALDTRQIAGMRNALGSKDEGDAIWVEVRIALNDVEQREITQSHLSGLLHGLWLVS